MTQNEYATFTGNEKISKNVLPDKIVINARANMAPANTVNRGCLIAIIAAMKKVLSPISDTRITDKAAAKAWIKPKLSWGTSVPDVPFRVSVFCKG